MNADQQNQEIYKEEYKLVFEGCKFAASLRFVTVAFATSVQSALFTIYTQSAAKENRFNVVIIFIIAMLFLVAPVIIEVRTTSLYRNSLKRGSELEFYLGNPNGIFHKIAEISKKEKKFRFTHTRGIALVYLGIFTLWIMFLVETIVRK